MFIHPHELGQGSQKAYIAVLQAYQVVLTPVSVGDWQGPFSDILVHNLTFRMISLHIQFQLALKTAESFLSD